MEKLDRRTAATTAIVYILAVVTLCHAADYTPIKDPGYCAMHNICSTTGNWVNCVNNSQAFYPPVPFINSTSDLCGHLYQSKVCCSIEQYITLNTQIQQAQSLFGRCPACLNNFMEFWCEFTCSPNQAQFVTVTDRSIGSSGNYVVNLTQYRLNTNFTNKFWNSCNQVQFGATGIPVVKQVMGADTPLEWFSFLGKPIPDGYAPFQITFAIQDDQYAMNRSDRLQTCNAAYPDTCSCADCPGTCPVIEYPSSSGPSWMTIFHHRIQVMDFSFIVTWVTAIVAIFVMWCIYPRLNCCVPESKSNDKQPVGDIGTPAQGAPGGAPMASPAHFAHATLPPKAFLERQFYKIGMAVGRHPGRVILASLFVTACFSAGIALIDIQEDPVKLWVPPSSEALNQKELSDAAFGPFYRTEQFFLSRVQDGSNSSSLDLLYAPILYTLQEVQNILQNVTAEYNGETLRWEDLCNRPVPSKGCIVESATQWFAHGPTLTPDLDRADVIAQVTMCSNNPTLINDDQNCMSDIGVPAFPFVVLGGYPVNYSTPAQNPVYIQPTALITTYLLNNADSDVDRATAWEEQWLATLRQQIPKFEALGLRVSYSTESSIQSELATESSADISTVAYSYLLMFVYISIALGHVFPLSMKWTFVRTKFVLGVCAIFTVVCALAISIGLCSIMGVQATLIISEVIPFLVLAIGIDNVFILLNTFQSKHPSLPREVRLAETLGEVGMSITLSSLAECFAFALGALTRMPAVQAFAIYAAVAIFADYVLQLTCFAALMVLDEKRRESNRVECCPCIQVEVPEAERRLAQKQAGGHADDVDPLDDGVGVGGAEAGLIGGTGAGATAGDATSNGGAIDPNTGLRRCFREVYAPCLMHRTSKVAVIISFIGMLLVALSLSVHFVEMGLDQRTALPRTSYLQDYFGDLTQYFRISAPVYFIVDSRQDPDALYTSWDTVLNQNRICSSSFCSPTSLSDYMTIEAKNQNQSLIYSGVSSWIDDYFLFLHGKMCCRLWAPGHGQPPGTYCPPSAGPGIKCRPCINPNTGFDEMGRPSPEDFKKFLPIFLNSTECVQDCAVCGTAHYADVVLNNNTGDVIISRFRSYHSVLTTQADYINALKSGRRISSEVSGYQNIPLFAYSVFYVFFEQYLYIVSVAWQNVGLAMAAIMALCLFLLRNVWASGMICITIAMILTDLLGVMGLFDIYLNAISVVNIVMAIGISVEFCIHITVSFMSAKGTHDARVQHALTTVGSSVFSGIFLTKFFGVIVLSMAKSELFEIYYFRMYLAICLLGGLHGLMFLPVLLSLFGPAEDAPPFWACCLGGNADAAGTGESLLDPAMGYADQNTSYTKPNHTVASVPNSTSGDGLMADHPHSAPGVIKSRPPTNNTALANPVANNGTNTPAYSSLPQYEALPGSEPQQL